MPHAPMQRLKNSSIRTAARHSKRGISHTKELINHFQNWPIV